MDALRHPGFAIEDGFRAFLNTEDSLDVALNLNQV
jgi:hypothetical protein